MAKVKIIGKRKKSSLSFEDINNFLKAISALRGEKPFIPKGVYRFKTFEEAQDWTMDMITKSIPDHRR
jgi:hypothetical protein